MRVYVVAGYRKSEIWFSSEITEDWPTEYRVRSEEHTSELQSH